MQLLTEHHGSWTGTTRFRLRPTDDPDEGPATATVTVGGGSLTSVAYTWEHATDGAQDGLLVLGPAEEPHQVTALWSDSWHQKTAQVLTGAVDGTAVTMSFTYGGDWGWVITLDAADPGTLRIRMDNVLPASMADDDHTPGPYWAMSTELRRSR